jgi:quercetin dioxygenase-like cupin family protein
MARDYVPFNRAMEGCLPNGDYSLPSRMKLGVDRWPQRRPQMTTALGTAVPIHHPHLLWKNIMAEVAKIGFAKIEFAKTLAVAIAATTIGCAGIAGSADAEALSPKIFGDIRSEAIEWRPFPAFPPEARLAVLVGDPTKPGPYVVRVKVPANVKLMPHVHPEDRIYTVISGVFYIGVGDSFDADKLVAYGPGSVVVLPANTPHFHWARSGEYVTQVTGYGPLGISYLDPHNDPRETRAR